MDINISYFESALKKQQAELSRANDREDIAIEYVADDLDRVVNQTARELALRDKDRNAGTLARVRAALQRIRTGDYGICITCDGDIAEARLRALPYAERCIPCQERHELEKDAAEVVADTD